MVLAEHGLNVHRCSDLRNPGLRIFHANYISVLLIGEVEKWVSSVQPEKKEEAKRYWQWFILYTF